MEPTSDSDRRSRQGGATACARPARDPWARTAFRPRTILATPIVAILGALASVACGGDGGDVTEPEPNEAPTASISSPTGGATFDSGEQITFEGSADDPEDGQLSGDALVWKSDVDGQIGTGESFTRSDLSSANHTITLTATDSDGDTDTDEVGITVQDPQSPSASITSPEDGSTVQEGDEITFEGSAEDPQDGQLGDDALQWESNVDGEIGTGKSFTRSDLTAGETHTVTLTATDSDGNTGTASVQVAVNAPPSASISSPSDGSSFSDTETITFEGSGNDAEDGELSGDALVWESDVDGEIGTGQTVETDALNASSHTITLTATDSDGATATASIGIGVTGGPSVTIRSPRDEDVFAKGTTITFEGSASDEDDGSLTGDNLVWKSDVDGELGTGKSVDATLTAGETHEVTLTATNSDGTSASASIEVVVNIPPTATVDAPPGGSSFDEGQTITFEGSGDDPEDGALTEGSLQWESDVDGGLGSGETVEATLSAGATTRTHAVTLTASDQHGATATASVDVTVRALGSVSGAVTRENDGAGMGGRNVALVDDTGAEVAVASTAANGSYTFSDVAAGTYTVEAVEEEFPEFGSFTSATSRSVTVDPGEDVTGVDFRFEVPEVDLTTRLDQSTVAQGDVVTVTVAVSFDTNVITDPLSAATGAVTWDANVATGLDASDQIGNAWDSGVVDDSANGELSFNVLATDGVSGSPATLITFDMEAAAVGETDITPSLSELKTINTTTQEQTELLDFVILNTSSATLTVQ